MPADNSRPFDRIVGYVRVSTKSQGLSGLGLEAQRAAIEAHARKLGVPVAAIFEEVESGTRSDRPQLAQAIHKCSTTDSALVAARVDRFGRKAGDLLKLRDAPFPVIPLDAPNADSFLFGILALVSQKERDSISERTKAALQAAKDRGTKLGNPKAFKGAVYREAGKAAVKRANTFAQTIAPDLRDMVRRGISLNRMAQELKASGVKTARGGEWTATAVRNVLARLPA